MSILDKINEISTPDASKWIDDAKWRAENRDWLNILQKIAVKILNKLRDKEISKEILSEKSNIPLNIIDNIVKGGENLDLKTIVMLEKALDVKLI